MKFPSNLNCDGNPLAKWAPERKYQAQRILRFKHSGISIIIFAVFKRCEIRKATRRQYWWNAFHMSQLQPLKIWNGYVISSQTLLGNWLLSTFGSPVIQVSKRAQDVFMYRKIMMTSANGKKIALLSLCEANPPVTGRFTSQRPVTQSFDVLFDLHLNKRLRK